MNGTLGGYSAAFADDDGSADPELRKALAGAGGGDQAAYLDALVALCMARLLVPLVAGGDETMTHDPEREGHMSTALLQRPDGQKAMLAFTGSDAMAQWFERARPVPATLDVVCQTAQHEGAGTVLIDLEGPAPLVLEEAVIAEIAQGHRLVRLDDGYGWMLPGEGGASGPEA